MPIQRTLHLINLYQKPSLLFRYCCKYSIKKKKKKKKPQPNQKTSGLIHWRFHTLEVISPSAYRKEYSSSKFIKTQILQMCYISAKLVDLDRKEVGKKLIGGKVEFETS